MPIALTTVLISTLAGAIVLAMALRGRRIDDHPICRRCGFDLTGLHQPGAKLFASQCPECGRRFTSAKQIRWGARARRPGLALLGGLMLLITLSGGGMQFWRFAQDYEWRRLAPTWALMLETHREDDEAAGAAIRELLRRSESGRLSESDLALLATQTRVRCFDWSMSWTEAWRDLAEETLRFHSPDQILEMINVRARFERAHINLKSPTTADVLGIHMRWTVRDAVPGMAHGRLHSVRIDDIWTRLSRSPQGMSAGEDFNALNWAIPPLELTPGPHEIEIDAELRFSPVEDRLPEALLESERASDLTQTRGFRRRETIDFTIEPAENQPPGPQLLDDADTRNHLRSVIEARLIDEGATTEHGYHRHTIRLTIDEPGVHVAADVFLRINGRLWLIGDAHTRPDESDEIELRFDAPDGPVAEADLILRPNPRRIRTNPPDSIWGEAITLKDIEIHQAAEDQWR